MANTKFQDSLAQRGICDNRKAAFCATATVLADNYGYGIVLLAVKDNMLSIYDVAMNNEVRELLCQVELSKIEGLKIRAWFFSQVLKFRYNGQKYSFTNFIGVKPMLKVIEEESQK